MNTITCLFENQHIYALHKPPMVPFHSLDEVNADGKSVHVEGIVSLAKTFLNDERIFPVHRLDRMTSGLMLFARTKEANSLLSQAFAEKRIEKYYLALSVDKPKKKQGSVTGDMTKSRSGSYILKRSNENPAITRFFTKKVSLGERPAWFYILKPETGKTHQLRVALKSLGSPILGDSRYGGGLAGRGYLHAYKIRFSLFDTLYEIEDPIFSGNEFDLSEIKNALLLQESTEQDAVSFLSPEKLSWPKASFRLPLKA